MTSHAAKRNAPGRKSQGRSPPPLWGTRHPGAAGHGGAGVDRDHDRHATYLGTVPEQPHAFDLDDHHRFFAGKPAAVCGNTADMLAGSRYAPHFAVVGDKATHFGLFPCGPGAQAAPETSGGAAGCC